MVSPSIRGVDVSVGLLLVGSWLDGAGHAARVTGVGIFSGILCILDTTVELHSGCADAAGCAEVDEKGSGNCVADEVATKL